MESAILKIKQAAAPLVEQITHHPVYTVMQDLADVQVFMQYHVYAVWDFMSLLKALQQNLTCTSLPWFPKGDANTRYLINEIVVGEESDVDAQGNRCSHFELYLKAMSQCGAATTEMLQFINSLKQSGDLQAAYQEANTPQAAQDFVNFTFKIINSKADYLQAAVFSFGREDLIPEMFYALVKDLSKTQPEAMQDFIYYLERHIEVDGGHHSHLAMEMTSNLCNAPAASWAEAEAAVLEALQMRIRLWDGAYQAIMLQKKSNLSTASF